MKLLSRVISYLKTLKQLRLSVNLSSHSMLVVHIGHKILPCYEPNYSVSQAHFKLLKRYQRAIFQMMFLYNEKTESNWEVIRDKLFPHKRQRETAWCVQTSVLVVKVC